MACYSWFVEFLKVYDCLSENYIESFVVGDFMDLLMRALLSQLPARNVT
jgi:hypothetical protein